MPGTGHSARYKGSISNRSKISPFEHLAKWNQQLLGADGAVPSIVGGNSLEFKKLDASDITGVMTNPATANLNMSALTITNCNQINTRFISDVQQITGISNTGLSITTSDQDISINSGKNLRLTCGVNTTAASTSIDIRHANNKPGDINIGWETGTTANNDIVVGKGNTSTGDHQVRILSDTITGGDNRVLIGSQALTAASFQSLTTGITGVNTLKLSGGQITIGTGAQRLGFFGVTPQPRPTVVANVTAIYNALVTLGLFQ